MNFVPSICWVKQGAAMNLPHKVEMNSEDLKNVLGEFKEDSVSDDEDEDELTGGATAESDDIETKYHMDDFDDEDADNLTVNLAGLACYASSKDDPHLRDDVESTDSEDEKDAFQIQETDNLLVIGRVDDQTAVMEVHVYNDDEGDLYVHHEVILPAYPVTMEWLNFDPSAEDGTTGNYLAVGDMTPIIRIWNLDVVDSLEPIIKLGRNEKKKRKDKPKVKGYGHKDAVISLHWNRLERHVLASGSADSTAILWDLNTAHPTVTLSEHTDRIQAVRFHPFEAPSLLSAGSDSSIRLWDVREASKSCRSWKAEGEVEKLLWDHFAPFYFFAAAEPGHVLGFDVRNDKGPVFTLAAHEKSVTCMTLSNFCVGLMVTGGPDELVKVWDVEDKAQPRFVLETSLGIGELLSMEASVDHPFVVAVGGDEGEQNVRIFDLVKKFPAQMESFKGKRLMKVVDTIENRKTNAQLKAKVEEENGGAGDTKEMETDGEDDMGES
ncbi:periodic tryptophan protein 1-like [Tropilaelaps mercedesae]|uniref:Periodic tryptophan protein 1-like n=1 Tax=Tropilaelaps mercedesae TaxID=418985 RepID=A0A1V9WYJ9_9ACAR|nr:periodic tryptophan protein 1-like [Tropilaelaps mercedesae]